MKVVALSPKAIADLRIALQKDFGADFVNALSDEEINRIGLAVLTGIVESLKLEIAYPELAIKPL